MLVARHGEQRIQRQLTRRVLAQQNAIKIDPEEVISLGEIDPKNLSRETLEGLMEALQQGARFDKKSSEKLQHFLSSSPNH